MIRIKAVVKFEEPWLKKVAPYGTFVLFLSIRTALYEAFPLAKFENDDKSITGFIEVKKSEEKATKLRFEEVIQEKAKPQEKKLPYTFEYKIEPVSPKADGDAKTEEKKDDGEMGLDEIFGAISDFSLKSTGGEDPKPAKAPEQEEKTAEQAEATRAFDELLQAMSEKKEEKAKPKAKTLERNEKLLGIAMETKKLTTAISEEVKGQNHAIEKLINGYFKMCAFAPKGARKGARATFLFAGPPGVGKTMLAELFAEQLKLPFLRVDMSEFSEDESHCSFNGLNPSYKAASEGKVTGFVDKHPKCVVLFDEVEKAHINTLHLFYQMLDRGELEDVYHQRPISFKDAILIFTTNAGRNLYEDGTAINLSTVSDKTVIKALKTDINAQTGEPYFPEALVSRMSTGTIVMFDHLQPLALYEILERRLAKQVKALQEDYDVKFTMKDEVLSVLLYEEGGRADARVLTAKADRFIAEELRELLNRMPKESLNALKKRRLNIKVGVDLDGAPAEIKGYFTQAKVKALVLCSEEKKAELPKISGVQYVFAHSLKEAKRLSRTDISFAMVDVFFGLPLNSPLPSSADDVLSDGVEFVLYLKTYAPELLCYALCDERDGYTVEAYESLLSSGVRGLLPFSPTDTAPYKKAMLGVKKNTQIGQASVALARSNMQISFNSAQYFSEDGMEVEVRLQRLVLARSVNAEDSEGLVSDTARPKVKFSDVIGANDAKETLQEFIGFLKDPKAYTAKGIRPPRGVLLYGPPGTGKTLIAKALAGETNVAFLQKNSTEFFRSYVGDSARSVRELFRLARRYAPAIIFIDEVDAFAKNRTGGLGSGVDAQILNAFLSEMDGFIYDEKRPVLIVAATNYTINDEDGAGRMLDPAFVRRFDRKIKIDLPNTAERAEFIHYYLKKHEITNISEGTVQTLALRSYACSPADLEMIVELAIRNARGKDLTDELLTEAFDMERFGEANKVSQESLLQTTYHEAGHTLVAYLCGEKPTFVTNISRSNFGGYMLHEIDDLRTTRTRQELLDRICCALAGRCAELAVFGGEKGLTTGASGDLRTANELAVEIVNNYAMTGGLVTMDVKTYGTAVGQILYEKVEKILLEQYERAMQLIENNRAKLEKLTDELMKKNSLTKDEIMAVLK